MKETDGCGKGELLKNPNLSGIGILVHKSSVVAIIFLRYGYFNLSTSNKLSHLNIFLPFV